MQSKSLRLSFAVLAFISFSYWGCTKIDTTELGADLIPAVDNVHTFEEILPVVGAREPNIDTTRLGNTENHIVGRINDPVFGNTNADFFMQVNPGTFPYYFGNPKDTINSTLAPGTKFDSVILCLSYKGFYGDTSVPQTLKVYSLDPQTSNFVDTGRYRLDYQPDRPFTGNLLGQVSVKASGLGAKMYIAHGKDSVTNQIRIPLSSSFLNTLAAMDSSATSSTNAFRSDSLFKTFFKGFAIVAENSVQGNGGLFYISLTDPMTRLEVHYTRKNVKPIDTSYSSFAFSVGTALARPGAHANYVKRDTSSSEFPTSPDANALYVQSAPGSAINLSIPGLSNYPNRIIHRAELFLEQIPGNPVVDKVLTAPAYLYLDLIDSTANLQYKPVYYDLSPNSFYNPDDKVSFFPTTGIDHNYYGGFLRTTTDALGTRSFYTFNLTRYVQNMITKHSFNYKLRVTAPYNLSYYGLILSYSNSLAAGRVKLGNGTHPNYKLRMRIVYSIL